MEARNPKALKIKWIYQRIKQYSLAVLESNGNYTYHLLSHALC